MKRRHSTVLVAATMAVALASTQARAQEPSGPPAPFTHPPVYVGIAAAAGGLAAVIKGISLVSTNGNSTCDNTCSDVYTTGPTGYVWVGLGAATAMAGAALIDWSTLTPTERTGRRAKLRRWSYAAIGGGALIASLGGALILKERNDREDKGLPKFTSGRALGWSAAVLGTAAALVGIEGLTLQLLNVTAKDGQSQVAMGLGYHAQF